MRTPVRWKRGLVKVFFLTVLTDKYQRNQRGFDRSYGTGGHLDGVVAGAGVLEDDGERKWNTVVITRVRALWKGTWTLGNATSTYSVSNRTAQIHLRDAIQSQSLEACTHRLLRAPF